MNAMQWMQCNNAINECNAMKAININKQLFSSMNAMQWKQCNECNAINAMQWMQCNECNAIML